MDLIIYLYTEDEWRVNMRKYGVHYTNETRINIDSKNVTGDMIAIKAVLEKLEEGYKKRDTKQVDEYIKSLFINDESLYILGTSSDELCTGVDGVRELLESDWEYWGDVSFQLDNVIINGDEDTAWFATPGTVKYSFEHNKKRYDGYVEFAMKKANDESMTAEQRIAIVNWVMALTYHQQDSHKRDYFCPMRLTGVMIKENNQWKITHSHFSMAKGVFADQRFELSQEFVDDFKSEKQAFLKYKTNELDYDIEMLLKDFASDCIGQKNVSISHVDKYFSLDNVPYIVSPDTEWYVGREPILDFLKEASTSELVLDTDSAIAQRHGNQVWVTGIGTVKQIITSEEVANRAIEALNDINVSDKTSQEKLFGFHRQVAYVLKESSFGDEFTCPIRYSVMITYKLDKPKIEQIHFSYPNYWIMEGKLDTRD